MRKNVLKYTFNLYLNFYSFVSIYVRGRGCHNLPSRQVLFPLPWSFDSIVRWWSLYLSFFSFPCVDPQWIYVQILICVGFDYVFMGMVRQYCWIWGFPLSFLLKNLSLKTHRQGKLALFPCVYDGFGLFGLNLVFFFL